MLPIMKWRVQYWNSFFLLCELFGEFLAVHNTETNPSVKNELGILGCDLRDAAFLNVSVSLLLSTRTCVNTWVLIWVVMVNQQCFYH